MRIRPLLALLLLPVAACEQARQYPAVSPADKPAAPGAKAASPEPPAHWSWLAPSDSPRATPIEFIPSSSDAWAALPRFWNVYPPPGAGVATIHFGLPPLQAVVAVGLADEMQPSRVRIKVPRGLPDPAPLIPEANPPSVEKWQLGKKLFFAPILRTGAEVYACATCHDPAHGFTQGNARPRNGAFNTPSLINAVYNRHQFWDGRAIALEEVVVRSLQDESAAGRSGAEVTHVWGGLVKLLATDDTYQLEFQRVFGIPQPTQDAVAKALATYLRTILSGDSIYDRAALERDRDKDDALRPAHFAAVLADEAALRSLDSDLDKAEAARQLALGHRLFHGKARCAACHRPPLFTDHDFHNIGVSARDSLPPPETPTGRFTTVPIGLKELRLVGAYKMPSLRALPRTAPYFHDGKRRTLREVVTFYDHEIRPTPYLALPLRDDDHEQILGLSGAEIDALVLFLRALDGTAVDRKVALP